MSFVDRMSDLGGYEDLNFLLLGLQTTPFTFNYSSPRISIWSPVFYTRSLYTNVNYILVVILCSLILACMPRSPLYIYIGYAALNWWSVLRCYSRNSIIDIYRKRWHAQNDPASSPRHATSSSSTPAPQSVPGVLPSSSSSSPDSRSVQIPLQGAPGRAPTNPWGRTPHRNVCSRHGHMEGAVIGQRRFCV